MNLRNNIAQLFLCLLLLTCFGWCKAWAQDSTYIGYKSLTVVDSIIYGGDTLMYSFIDEDFHYSASRGLREHVWVEGDHQRICTKCHLWEIFHVNTISQYDYSPFYKAKKQVLELMRKGK